VAANAEAADAVDQGIWADLPRSDFSRGYSRALRSIAILPRGRHWRASKPPAPSGYNDCIAGNDFPGLEPQEEPAMKPNEVLERLVSVAHDSETRLRHAAKDVSKEYLVRFFEDQARARRIAREQLEVELQRVGGNDRDGHTIGGVLDTIAMDINVIHSMGDTGVVDWCRKDAEQVIHQYDKALAENLPADIKSLLQRQRSEITNAIGSMERVLAEYGGPRS
jgi:uncharacterized protein (TIGR02284 family)